MENHFFNRREWLTPSFVFLVAFTALLLGLNPTFYVDDSPETITACRTLGLSHPPGYPLYTLVGRLFSLLPVAHFPFRVNLFSAALAAGVSTVLFLLLGRVLRVATPLAALFSLFWVTGSTAYPSALSAKGGMYHLTALFLLTILWALWRGRLGLALFLFGLSCAHHWMTMAVFSPGLAFLAFQEWREKEMEKKRLLILASFFLVGLSVYLFLPLRATQKPFLSWENISFWHHFVFDLFLSPGPPSTQGDLEIWIRQGWACLRAVFIEFPYFQWLALCGAVALYSVYRQRMRGLFLVGGMMVVAIIFILRLPPQQFFLIRNYILPANVFILLFSAWGLETILSRFDVDRQRSMRFLLNGLLALLFLGLAVAGFARARQTNYTHSYDYVLNGLKALPRNALYFCGGDSVIFPCWYFQWAEGKRPDVAVVSLDGLPMDWTRESLARFHPGLKVPFPSKSVGLEAVPALALRLVEQNRDRAFFFSYNQGADETLSEAQTVPYGLTEQGFLPREEPVWSEGLSFYLWDFMRLRHVTDSRSDPRSTELIFRNYGVFRNNLGVFCENLAEQASPSSASRSGSKTKSRVDPNQALYCYQRAYENFYRAAQWDPTSAQFAYNTANSLYHLGRIPDSMFWYEKATDLNPQLVVAYFNWALAALSGKKHELAGALLQKVLELEPDYPEAKEALKSLIQKGLYKPPLSWRR